MAFLTTGLIYRRGAVKPTNLTPRPQVDTVGRPGQAPGLSTSVKLGAVCGMAIDAALLVPPLRAIADDPTQGGSPGHVAIVPVNESGQVDQALLEEWAATRGSGVLHPLSVLLERAIVAREVDGPT